MGHFERNCKQKNAQENGKNIQQANIIEEEKEEEPEERVFLAYHLPENDLHSWLIDSRCTCHIAKEIHISCMIIEEI